jgi:hypothetical protein
MNTPDNIESLKPNEIFVFGSNEAGRHDKGAALTALRKFGAIYGQAAGLQGQSYGIPTVDQWIKNKLPIYKIQEYIDKFITYAFNHQDLIFYVTEIGCGLAGYKVEDIAPLFKEAKNIKNIILPKKFE